MNKISKHTVDTFFFHAGSEALLQSTVSALISLVFVHDALSVEPVKYDKDSLGSILGKVPANQEKTYEDSSQYC